MTTDEAWDQLQAAVALTTAGCSVVLSPHVAAVLLASRPTQEPNTDQSTGETS
jgi:hypothetical protein